MGGIGEEVRKRGMGSKGCRWVTQGMVAMGGIDPVEAGSARKEDVLWSRPSVPQRRRDAPSDTMSFRVEGLDSSLLGGSDPPTWASIAALLVRSPESGVLSQES
jgi:hypothetical protein